VPARHQQREERKVGRRRFEHRREQMPFEVMHPERGPSPRESEAAGDSAADQQRSDQPGPGCVSHPIELFGLGIGVRPVRVDQRQEPTDVISGRQLRHDTAVFGMHLHLAMQAMRQQPGPAVIHGAAVSSQEVSMPRHPHIR
jgi:hypothetical protein